MTTAREIMTPGADRVRTDETVRTAARRTAAPRVDALPLRGAEDDRLKGMLTDHDVVTRVLARGHDPHQLRAGELAQEEAVTVGADDEVEEVIATMPHHGVRRLPVIDGHRLVGVVARADLARALPAPDVGEPLQALSAD
ncbi:CBS domain-containing protein [Streptomyces sp. NPDC005438]|uniref:CBS domain-containing protein n=1 Tax=Streptomyces sp. NPDC005438 TaxID=3156880 RepID=UPI0033B6A9FF